MHPTGDPQRPLRGDFRVRLRHGDTYGLLLLLIVVSYILMAVFEDTRWGRLILSLAFGGVILLALHTSSVPRRFIRIVLFLIVISVVVALVQAITDSDIHFELGGYLIFGLTVIAPVAVLIRIARRPRIDVETILGALSAYLLIGILFAGFYRAGQSINAPFFQQTEHPSPIEFLYFSFTTLTTTGYGDLSPAQNEGRVLANLEQLTGQVFLVTIVASLVGSFGKSRRQQNDDAQRTEEE